MPEIHSGHIGFLRIIRDYPGISPSKLQKIYGITMKTILTRLEELLTMCLVTKFRKGNRTEYTISDEGIKAIKTWDKTIRELMRS